MGNVRCYMVQRFSAVPVYPVIWCCPALLGTSASCTSFYSQKSRISQYWLPVDYKPTHPQFDSRWYTFGFIPDVVTNCKVLPG